MNSLLVVSLPRSLSSYVYELCRLSLGFHEPSWSSDGEILNPERFSGNTRQTAPSFIPYATPEIDAQSFDHALTFLASHVEKAGFVYKDVSQPFVVRQWLQSNPMPVIKVRRCVTDVAFSMLARQWYYPKNASCSSSHLVADVVEGLLRATKALEAVEGEVLDFDEFIFDQTVLSRLLSRLYPEATLREHPLDFVARRREEIVRRRQTQTYEALDQIVHELKQGLEGAD